MEKLSDLLIRYFCENYRHEVENCLRRLDHEKLVCDFYRNAPRCDYGRALYDSPYEPSWYCPAMYAMLGREDVLDHDLDYDEQPF